MRALFKGLLLGCVLATAGLVYVFGWSGANTYAHVQRFVSVSKAANVYVANPMASVPNGSIPTLETSSSAAERRKTTQLNQKSEDAPGTSGQSVIFDMKALLQEASKRSECRAVIKDPKSFWRSQPGPKFTAIQDGKRMATAFRCGILDEDFLRRPPHPDLYPFEQQYLAHPPATNVNQLTSLDKTKISLVSGSSEIPVGQPVTVRIEARDALGHQKPVGGDEVRVWLEDAAGAGSISAKIQDFGNGTYQATTVLQWAGKFRVKVAIAYNMEYIRALLHMHRVYKMTRLFVAQFANKKANETTPCFHARVVPGGYTDFCNMTDINGSPWFCGRPVKNELACTDFKGSHNGPLERTTILPTTPEEFKILHTPYKDAELRLVKSTQLSVTATDPDRQQLPKPCGGSKPCPLCNEIPARQTWDQHQPTGYLYKNIWHPLHCQVHSFTREQCFKDTEWILLGDSNLRSHYASFCKGGGCVNILKALTKKWHKPLFGKSKALNFTVRWEPHMQPFLNGRLLAELGSLVSSAGVIEKLPSWGRYVIILDHYYHLSACHTSTIEVKYSAIRDALERLFKRNPHAIALIQSPYVSYYGWSEHFGAGDMLGRHYIKIIHQVFSDPAVRDRVLFISAWDVTQAIANVDMHPGRIGLITSLMQNYVCGRTF